MCFLLLSSGRTYADCVPSLNSSPLSSEQLACVQLPHALPSSLPQYTRYLDDTLQSLDKLRGKNGLLQDSAEVLPGDSNHPAKLKIMKSDTSPTDIGLDLLTQASVAKGSGSGSVKATETMMKIVSTLGDEKFPVHHPLVGRGPAVDTNHILFFSWYSTKENKATVKNVSSVDNLHLALALWTVAKNFPDQAVGQKAQTIFNKIDLSSFYDPKTGLMGGNFTYDKKAGTWSRDAYNYQYFGAEARSIYGVGYALGLFKTVNPSDSISKTVNSLTMELYPTPAGNILRTWDGGAFQTILPEDLINEDAYSPKLAESAHAFGPFILQQGTKVGGTFVPAGFSAGQIGRNAYAAQAGNPQLIATIHKDYCDPVKKEDWTKSFTPHAALFAATVSPELADRFSAPLSRLENYSSGKDKLYNSGIGFSDGLIVDPKDLNYGKVVPGVLALDQLFIAQGIMRMSDPQGDGLSANTLADDPDVSRKLQQFYSAVDEKLQTITPNTDPVSCPTQAQGTAVLAPH
jgi:hypothetical protein